MKNSILTNRKLIWFSIKDKLEDIGLGDVSIISEGKPTKIYIFVSKKLKKNNIPTINSFRTFIIYNGECECFIETYESFEKELIKENKKYLSLCKNGTVIFDVKRNFNSTIHSAVKKKNSFSIIRLFLNMYNKLLYLNRVC